MSTPQSSVLPRLSVIVVTYNSASRLRPTLDALFEQDYPGGFEAILVENASKDDSLAIAREYESRGLRVIPRDTNRGFAGGNNDGVAASHGEFVFLLNPDAILEPGGLREIARALGERPDAGIVGAKLVTEDFKTILHCGGEIGTQAHCRLFGRGEEDRGQHDAPAEVEFVVGAALGIRRDVWDALGGFDEGFNPAYYEDADLCFRCRQKGWKVLYWPVRLRHHENVSVPYLSPSFLRMHHRNRLWFLVKNTGIAKLLFVVAPAEVRWLLSHHSRGLRRICARLYPEAMARLVGAQAVSLLADHRSDG